MSTSQELQRRGEQYVNSKRISADFKVYVGFGEDGKVWLTSRQTVIKVFERFANYRTELACYKRLMENSITEIEGLIIPELFDFDDSLMVIEMTYVVAPWLIDFGKCYIDQVPPYDARERYRETLKLRKVFKEDFPKLLGIMLRLRQYGIYYTDARKSNVRFTAEKIEDEVDDDIDDFEDDYDELESQERDE